MLSMEQSRNAERDYYYNRSNRTGKRRREFGKKDAFLVYGADRKLDLDIGLSPFSAANRIV